MYSRQVLARFQDMTHVGELGDADAYVRVENPACGDVLQLALKVQDGRIIAAKFRARGCVAAIACGSQLTGMIQDRTLTEARTLRRDELVKALGGLPQASIHASHLALEALVAALQQLSTVNVRHDAKIEK
jgi:NifU-like protein involved in Fe-S cluster formation